ncbi:MAG TPA: lysozyme, partial [Methanosarcina sp.]|nr:lysozyme [Methanosarcina sp.]
MKPSEFIIDFCASFEGYHKQLPNGDCTAYPDPGSKDGKPFTIGWGTTTYNVAGRAKYNRVNVQLGDTLTREQAEAEFDYDLNEVAEQINKLNVTLNQNEFDACVSFFSNCGFPKAMVDRLKRSKKEFAEAMELYVNGEDGKPLAGLVRRREAEKELFLKPVLPSKTQGDWWLITKDGIFEMLGDKYVSAIEFDGSFTIKPDYFRNNNVVINMNRAKPEMLKNEHPNNDYSTAKLIATGGKYENNRWVGLLRMTLIIGDERFSVCSGQARAQTLRLPTDPKSVPGNAEPIPQGTYKIGNIAWAGGKDNYTASHGTGLGPIWIPLTATFPDDRNAFGIHLDAGAQGTMGCVGLYDVDQLKELV